MKVKKTLAALCALVMCAGISGIVPNGGAEISALTASAEGTEAQTEKKVVLDGSQLHMQFDIMVSNDGSFHAVADSVSLYCTALDGNDMTLLSEAYAYEIPNSTNNHADGDTHGFDVDESKAVFDFDSKYTYIAETHANGYFKSSASETYQYDPATETWVALAGVVAGGSTYGSEIPISASTFTMLSTGNLTSLTITSSDGNVLNNVNNTAFKAGTEYFDLRWWKVATWEAKYTTTETYEKVTTVTDYTVTGKFAGTIPYVTDTKAEVVSSKREDNGSTSGSLSPVISFYSQSPIDDNGKSVTFDYNVEGHGAVELIKDGELAERYTASDFDNGFYQIPDYDPNAYYFLKVAKTEKADDFLYFKLDNSIGKWVFRVDTSETAFTDMVFDLTTLPNVGGDFELVYTSDGDWYGFDSYAFKSEMAAWNFKDVGSYTRAEYLAGTAVKNEIPTNPSGAYYVYAENNGNTSHSCSWYRIIGIDIVPIGGFYNSSFACYAPTKSDAGDNVTVSGTNDDGEPVSYSTTQVLNNDTLPLPNGDYTVTDNTSGLVEKVEVVNGTATTVEDKADTLNLNEPVYANLFTITALNGDVIGAGTMKDKSVTADDITVKVAGKLNEAGVYARCESKYGIVNSVNAEDVTTENSYVGIAADSSFNKVLKDEAIDGDVDFDSDISVLDIIKEQKYLLKVDSLSFRDFCSADINRDGDVDIFDLALLKRNLITQNESEAE